MKKKVIRLDNKALRSIISEAIEFRQPGSPLFTPPKENKRLSEAEHDGPDSEYYVAQTMSSDDVADCVIESAEKYFGSMFNSEDPSMMNDRAMWNEQVQAAVSDLHTRVIEIVDDVESKLISGEYEAPF